MTPPSIKPIQTRYAGCHFRSRLEARWAVFFDHLEIEWQYELQGYELPSGPYLPDFLVHPGTPFAFWLEIKPTLPEGPRESQLVAELAHATGLRSIMYCRQPELPVPTSKKWINTYTRRSHQDSRLVVPAPGFEWAYWNSGLKETGFASYPQHESISHAPGDLWWTECPLCSQFVITNSGNISGCPSFNWDTATDSETDQVFQGGLAAISRVTSPRLMAAYAAARSARFEHGESPR